MKQPCNTCMWSVFVEEFNRYTRSNREIQQNLPQPIRSIVQSFFWTEIDEFERVPWQSPSPCNEKSSHWKLRPWNGKNPITPAGKKASWGKGYRKTTVADKESCDAKINLLQTNDPSLPATISQSGTRMAAGLSQAISCVQMLIAQFSIYRIYRYLYWYIKPREALRVVEAKVLLSRRFPCPTRVEPLKNLDVKNLNSR
jgi:hypothetical protein